MVVSFMRIPLEICFRWSPPLRAAQPLLPEALSKAPRQLDQVFPLSFFFQSSFFALPSAFFFYELVGEDFFSRLRAQISLLPSPQAAGSRLILRTFFSLQFRFSGFVPWARVILTRIFFWKGGLLIFELMTAFSTSRRVRFFFPSLRKICYLSRVGNARCRNPP